MALLQSREPRTVRALTQVVAQAAALLSTQATVDGLGHSELRLRARELVLQLLRERASRAEEQRLQGRGGDAEYLGDLVVRPSLELAQHDGLPLLRRNLRQRSEELADARSFVVLVVRSGLDDALVELDLTGSRLLLPEALLDRIARDREQPVRRFARPNSLLQRAVRVQEGRLRDVLGVGMVAEHRVRVAVDLGDVCAVEVVDLARCEMAGLGDGHE